jgi:hypothetical protein
MFRGWLRRGSAWEFGIEAVEVELRSHDYEELGQRGYYFVSISGRVSSYTRVMSIFTVQSTTILDCCFAR